MALLVVTYIIQKHRIPLFFPRLAPVAGGGGGGGGRSACLEPCVVVPGPTHTVRPCDLTALAAHFNGMLAPLCEEFDAFVTRKKHILEESKHDTIIRTAREKTQNESCMVCLEGRPRVQMICCGKPFHQKCLGQVITAAKQYNRAVLCPNFRAPIEKEDEDDLPPLPPPPRRQQQQNRPCVECNINSWANGCQYRMCGRCCGFNDCNRHA